MMSNYQACVGPSLLKLHIRDKNNPEKLTTLCDRTAYVQDYKASVPAVKICVACLKKICPKPGAITITAELIGVREIT